MSEKKFNGKEPLAAQEFVKNFMCHHDLMFQKDVEQWNNISHSINVLITYAMPSMLSDCAISSDDDSISFQELMFFKTEIDRSITYTLSNIPK